MECETTISCLAQAGSTPVSFERTPNAWRLNLQFFGQDPDKTEEATPKRKEDARKKGQIPKSTELTSVVVLFGLFLLLNMMGSWAYGELYTYLKAALAPEQLNLALNDTNLGPLIGRHVLVIGKLFLPLGFGALLIGVAVNFMQVGAIFTLEPLKPNFKRLNPLSGFGRFFSSRSLVELLKSLIKLVILIYVAYSTLKDRILMLNQSVLRSPLEAVLDIWSLLYQLAVKICGFLLVMAILDYGYQRWEHNKSLRMTKKEVKDEFKQMEGNPQIKSKIRQRQMQMATRRMMQDVPKADVVITNPTHFAIALRYDPASMAAPLVVAKGEALIAVKIKEIAAKHNVVMVENKPLAQTLFKTAEIGEAVPEKLFQAVAEVLAFVYRLKQQRTF